MSQELLGFNRETNGVNPVVERHVYTRDGERVVIELVSLSANMWIVSITHNGRGTAKTYRTLEEAKKAISEAVEKLHTEGGWKGPAQNPLTPGVKIALVVGGIGLALIGIGALVAGGVYMLASEATKRWGSPFNRRRRFEYLRPEFREKLIKVLEALEARGWKPVAADLYRSSEDQAKAYADFKAGKIARAAPPGYSPHEYGFACDVALRGKLLKNGLYGINWDVPWEFLKALGEEAHKQGLVWGALVKEGGDFKTGKSDPGHIELKGWRDIVIAEGLYIPKGGKGWTPPDYEGG